VRCAVTVSVLLSLGAAAWAAPAGARTESRPPRAPEQLWKRFPLSPPKSQTAQRPTSRTRGVAAPRRAASSDRGDSWSLLAAMAATVGTLGLALAFAPAAVARGWRRLGTGPTPKPVVHLEPRLRRAREPAASHDVVEDLLQVVAGGAGSAPTAPSRRVLAAAAGESSSGAESKERSEVEVLRTKRGAARDKDDVLKAKLTSDPKQARALKEKLRALEASQRAERKRATEVESEPEQPAEPAERKRAAEVESEPEQPAERPKPEQTAAPAPLPTIGPTGECHIAVWHGYVTSRFYAAVVGPDGEERVVAKSPAFRWRSPEPPPERRPGVHSAHRALVRQLQAAGWDLSGQGPEWFALRFRRRGSNDAPASEVTQHTGRRP
jgi:hypothetical protein